MRRVQLRSAAIVVAVAGILQFTAPSAQADPVTYLYTGSLFEFCGYGCPESAPADWASDYILASLTFDAPLPPNLPLTEVLSSPGLPGLVSWTMSDFLGTFSLSSADGPLMGFPEDGLPPLMLSTDANGNILDYIMGTSPAPGTVGTLVFVVNPPFFCEECDGIDLASGVAVNFGDDEIEWDAFSTVPGEWTRVKAVPEPSTLMLIGLGLAGIATRRRQREP